MLEESCAVLNNIHVRFQLTFGGYLASERWLFLCPAFLIVFLTTCAALGFAQNAVPASAHESPFDQVDRLLKEGKPGEAVVLLTAMSTKDPKTPGLEGKLGKAYFQSRQFAQASLHLKTALQQNADDAESARLLALTFYGAGNFRDALPLLERLGSGLQNDSPDAPFLLSICYVMTQQLDNARKSLAQMFSVPPDSPMAYLTLGRLLLRQHMVEAAVPQVETALRLEPRLVMAHFLLGEIDLYQSNPQVAVAEFQKELAVNPTLWLVYWRLGDAYVRLERYDEAEKVLKEAVWLNDGSSGALVLLGEIALKKNDPALSAGFLERALALDPQNLEGHDDLANAYRALGRESEASQQLKISSKLRSERPRSNTDNPTILP
jgi:tetratricopeptide (TPR) repeat protein